MTWGSQRWQRQFARRSSPLLVDLDDDPDDELRKLRESLNQKLPPQRDATYFDEGACHVPFADPYCPSVRPVAIATAQEQGWVPASSGTLVVIEGPRFSSRAESQWFAAQGWTLVGMTGHPEAVLARELALCYTPLALVTDLDAGVEEGEGVTQAEVFEVFAANIKRLRDLVAQTIAALPAEREEDLCAHALDGLPVPFDLP